MSEARRIVHSVDGWLEKWESRIAEISEQDAAIAFSELEELVEQIWLKK